MKTKSRFVALCLLLIAGFYGAHNFYLEQKRVAWIQFGMGMTWLTLLIVIYGTAFVSALRGNSSSLVIVYTLVICISFVIGLTMTLFTWSVVDALVIAFSKRKWLTWSLPTTQEKSAD